MSFLNLAKMYGMHLKNIDQTRVMFAELLEWAKTMDAITRKLVYSTYDTVLRAHGLTAEADATQAELAELKKQAPA